MNISKHLLFWTYICNNSLSVYLSSLWKYILFWFIKRRYHVMIKLRILNQLCVPTSLIHINVSILCYSVSFSFSQNLRIIFIIILSNNLLIHSIDKPTAIIIILFLMFPSHTLYLTLISLIYYDILIHRLCIISPCSSFWVEHFCWRGIHLLRLVNLIQLFLILSLL